jgi:hypothetical protein
MSSYRSSSRARKTARVVAGLAACVLVGSLQSQAVAQAGEAEDCAIRENFVEKAYIVNREDRTIPGPSSGDVSIARDNLFDAAGKRIGTTEVQATLYMLNDDVWQVVEGYDRFNDGAIYLLGPSSISAALRGEMIMISATGTSGRYRNKIGVRTFQLVSQEADHNVYRSSVYVCATEEEATAKAASSRPGK